MNIEEELQIIAAVPNGFKPMENFANRLAETYPEEQLEKTASDFYQSETYQIRMVAVFLFGKLAVKNKTIFAFMKNIVSKDTNWRVQEILAMAFDTYCKAIGYEKALPTIKEWLHSSCPNTRRAVSEGLRIWTNRPYFKNHPEIAVQLLASLRCDESDYVRKSCGNALRDISKKYPEVIVAELEDWGDSKEERQVQKLILKNGKLGDWVGGK
ncbi:DNA alkylation repair protein [Listeria grayi]|uniref:HEAT repeat protein n=1 Tax=Listeria grayi DSM 20601 TaxID=525367 RepID=D7V179_LISGR|nr:DNA alkylation repair protein [Listeria grayi]EFI83311.1 HEAT repeat protein [Listeria grayi DSM 20601]